MKAITQGIHHLGLTVTNVQQAADFFTQILNFEVVGGKPEYPAIFVSDGTVKLTLWQVQNPAQAAPFNRHTQPGLHHFALQVKDRNLLTDLAKQLSLRDDVAIEFMPEPLGTSQTYHMMCMVPGGVRLELIAP